MTSVKLKLKISDTQQYKKIHTQKKKSIWNTLYTEEDPAMELGSS